MNLDWHSKFGQVIGAMQKAGEIYAEAKSRSWQMQEMKSVMLARKAQEVAKSFPAMPQYKQEAEAKASPEYEQHIVGTAEAIHQELVAKSKYEKLSAQLEAYRSLCSLDKKTIEKDL